MGLLKTVLSIGMIFVSSTQSFASSEVKRLFERYLWTERVLIVFSPDTKNNRFQAQNRELKKVIAGLKDRDMVVWRLVYDKFVSIDKVVKPQLATRPFYRAFRVSGNQFTVLLIGKDGGEKLRTTGTLSPQRLFRVIDAMPMRQREMRENRQ